MMRPFSQERPVKLDEGSLSYNTAPTDSGKNMCYTVTSRTSTIQWMVTDPGCVVAT
jgi:hypothetical protein